MRSLMAIVAQVTLWLFLWTSAVSIMATVEVLADPLRREHWIRVVGLVTLAISVLIVLWAIT
jgi:hypothetical protein